MREGEPEGARALGFHYRGAQGRGCTQHEGGGVARAWPPLMGHASPLLRHSTERLAGDGVGRLDRVIGLVLV